MIIGRDHGWRGGLGPPNNFSIKGKTGVAFTEKKMVELLPKMVWTCDKKTNKIRSPNKLIIWRLAQ